MKAYSMDLRERVLKDSDTGIRIREVAIKYALSESWLRRLQQRRRENGETPPRSSRNRLQPKWLPYAKRLQEWVQEKPEITLRELRNTLGQAICLQTLSRVPCQLQRTFKKSGPRSRTRSAGRADATRLVSSRVLGIHPRHLIFLDETRANTKRTRRYGRARRGQRVVGKVPHKHWKTTKFVTALRQDGLTAPRVVDGPRNGDLFPA